MFLSDTAAPGSRLTLGQACPASRGRAVCAPLAGVGSVWPAKVRSHAPR